MFTNSIILMPSTSKKAAAAAASKAAAPKAKALTGNVKGKRKKQPKGKGITSTKKLAKALKNKAPDVKKAAVKTMVVQKLSHPKMTVNTALDPDLILDTIKALTESDIAPPPGPVEADTIRNLLLPKLYGLKNTGVVREILEVPANAGSVQGPSLYGCGGGGRPPPGSTSSWFFPGSPAEKEAMKNSGLVFCWMSLVACTFRQGGEGYCGRGINHEMEHALPCAAQVFASLLAQRLDLGSDKEYRKHHVILFEVMKVLLVKPGGTVTDQMVARYVYIIMLMIRRQQVILGLPSISVCNQKKCQRNLLRMDVDPITLRVRLSTNADEVREIMTSVGSSNSKGMSVGKQGKVKFHPCGWCGVDNNESAFHDDDRLRTLYASAYSTPAQQQAAIASANAFKGNLNKEGLLRDQCEKVCNKYNEMSEAEIVEGGGVVDLSRFIISASIIVLSVIIKSTYKELGVDTVHLPELFKWVSLAKETLSNATELDRLFGTKADGKTQDGAVWVIKKSQELATESGNKTTENYLKCRDGTISDLVAQAAPAGVFAGGGQTGGSTMDLEVEPGGSSQSLSSPAGFMDRVPESPGSSQSLSSPAGFKDWVLYSPGSSQSPSGSPGSPITPRTMEAVEAAMAAEEEARAQQTAEEEARAHQAWQAWQAWRASANFGTLIDEINSFFRYKDTVPHDNGVEENITLMFDYFESGGTGTNPDFISAVELNIDNLTDQKIIKLIESVEDEDEDEFEFEEERETEEQMTDTDTDTDTDSQMTYTDSQSEDEMEGRAGQSKEWEIEEERMPQLGYNIFDDYGGGKKKSKKTKRKSNKKNTKRKTKRKSNKKNNKRKSNKKNTKRKTNKKNTKSK
jgi:hypothetical protein